MDKFNFKILMVIISIIELTVCGTIYFFADNKYIFVIENLLVACCLSGTFTTITPLFNKIFKNELGAEMYGLTGFFIGLASFAGPILTKLLIKEDSDYLIIYSIGGVFCLIKFITLLFFDENKEFQFRQRFSSLSNQEQLVGITTQRPTSFEN